MKRSDTSIKTKRLWLRQIDETDAESIVALRSVKEVYKYFLTPMKIRNCQKITFKFWV